MAKHIVDVVYEFTIYKASRDFYEKHIKELNDIESRRRVNRLSVKKCRESL